MAKAMNATVAASAATETKATTTAVAVRGGAMTALEICNNMQPINALGQTLAQSGFFGRVSSSTATAALVNCFLEGLTPLEYKAKYHTFDNGQTGVKSDFIQREFHRLGGKWKFNRWDGDVCDMTFIYRGETLDFKVTLDEFKANGVAMSGARAKDNWAKFPREMLKARCMSTAIRALCPEALGGQYTQEEVADFGGAAMVQAQAVSVSPSPIAAATPAAAQPTQVGESNYAVCPCGSVRGKRWDELPTETLERILATPEGRAKALTAEHRNAIREELAARAEADGETGGAEVADAKIVDI